MEWLIAISGRVLSCLLLLAVTATLVSASSAPASGLAAGLIRLLPPPNGKSYFGFTVRTWDTTDPAWGDVRPFEARMRDSITNELAGKTPTFLRVWADWQASNEPGKPMVPFSTWRGDIARVRSITGQKSPVFLDWTLTNPGAEDPDYDGITTKDIAAGSADGYIRSYAQDIKADDGPFLIRLFGGEFNGSWWYSQSPYANHALTPNDFVKAWRRVVDIFREVGALNASFAWVPNVIPAANQPGWIDPNIAAYYPGDDYVDWAGADIYDVFPVSDLNSVYDFAVSHGKPFFVAEWAVRHDGSTLTPSEQRAWIESMFDFFDTHDGVKAISYFNYDNRPGMGLPLDTAKDVQLDGGQVNYQSNTNDDDHRLLADSGAGWRQLYSQRISSSRYISTALTEAVGGGSNTRPVATIVSVIVRGRTAIVRWRGNAAAKSFDVGLRKIPGVWKIVESGYTAGSYALHGARRASYAVRVRGRTASGAPGPWSQTRTLSLR